MHIGRDDEATILLLYYYYVWSYIIYIYKYKSFIMADFEISRRDIT